MNDDYRFFNPYNFVRYLPAVKESNELNDVRLLGRCQPPPHDRFIGLTGEMECELEVATPMFISDSEFVYEHDEHKSYQFFKLRKENGEEDFAIPSTSLRGMLRGIFEASTNSCFSVFEGGLLGKRKFDRNPLKAGRIGIIPDDLGKNGSIKSMSYYKLPHNDFSEYKDKYEENGDEVFIKIEDGKVLDVEGEEKSDYLKGYLKTSDEAGTKKNEYVLVADNSSEDFILSYKIYQNYLISNRNNKHRHTKKPNPGDTIWFRTNEEKMIKEFGYAQIYRKPFEKSIEDLLPKDLKPCCEYPSLCPACRVFGWVYQNKSDDQLKKVAYAGRVKINHAKIIETCGNLPPSPLAILSSPKPTTTYFYLLKNGIVDFNVFYDTNGAELRGRKNYIHQEEAKEQEYKRADDEEDKHNRTIRDALNPGAKFCFKIQFENLAPVELGALLWSIEMEKGMYHKLGLAKPLGFGSVKISIKKINILDPIERYGSFTGDGWRTIDDRKKIEWVRLFKETMGDKYKESFEELNNIKDIIAILSATPSDISIHYPRTSKEPDGSAKNFEWFMKNKIPLNIPSEETEGFQL